MTLSRKVGNPVTAHTIDLSPSGMRVHSKRPLHVDEVMKFALALDPSLLIDGTARVVREHALNTWALRVETIEGGSAQLLAQFVAAALDVIPREQSQAGS